ncbi:MAG: XRE family transcriptional regulator [Actinobacteria bacterium]|nr:MAG: XRE family transcriptional regulator [Actinomycetota bacterium]
MDIEIGQRLAARRRARGLSQEELAASLGVSRQAVSNWERAETAPDTDNLIALAKLYGITLDELLNREANGLEVAAVAPEVEAPNDSSSRPSGRRADTIALILAAAASFVFYYAVAQPLLHSTVEDITEIFGIGISPAMAITWILAEALFVFVPYVLLAPIARLTHSRSRMLWLVPLLVFFIPAGISIAWGAYVGVPAIEFSGIGGAVTASVALKTDILASIAGCMFAAGITRRRRSDTNN